MNTEEWTVFFENNFDRVYLNLSNKDAFFLAMKRNFYLTFPDYEGEYHVVESFMKIWIWDTKNIYL